MRKLVCVCLAAALLLAAGCAGGGGTPEAAPEDFAFSLTWGAYGVSSYDSATGRLVKTTDASNPAAFETTLTLTAAERETAYGLLAPLELEEYPDEYDPHPGAVSSPPETVILTVRMHGTEKTVACREIALNEVGGDARSRAFFSAVRAVQRLLTASPEWEALPDYERVYS